MLLKNQILLTGMLTIGCQLSGFSQAPDPYATVWYNQLHQSPQQEKFRKLAPMPAGVVYIQQPGEGEAEMRQHFRTMKQLGFNALKQIMPLPTWTVERIAAIALDEGIIPWWYGEGGYEAITPELLKKLGLPPTMSMADALKHPTIVKYQHNQLKERIRRMEEYARTSPDQKFMRTSSVAYDPEIGGRGLELNEKGETLFIDWLKKTYKTVEGLNEGWNQGHAGLFLNEQRTFRDWDDVAANWRKVTGREYRHVRDVLRFKVEHNLDRIRASAQQFHQFDPNAPYRGGGEIGLFNPIAWYGVDMAGIADVLTDYGSFYPSMHFSWHFGQVGYELTRSLYQQASLMSDLFKGGWTGGWESTGGPQQLDGERSGTDQNAYFVESGELMQLYLAQLAAGFKGFGIWCWNSRSAGKEGGEYSLLDRNGQVTERAIAIGKLGQAMQRWRFELWNAHKEPVVGILYDWENEALWAAMSIPGRDHYKDRPMKARVGLGRALTNANVPFEYVTPQDLKSGLGARYRVLYLPGFLCLRTDLMPVLTEYVRQGGRLVMDLPGAGYDEYSRVLKTGKGSPFEQLFGVTLDDFQYAGTNRPIRLGTYDLNGFVLNSTPTGARPVATYSTGRPAITEHTLGKGTAVLMGVEASSDCFKPGNNAAEALLLTHALGTYKSPYHCPDAIVYRLAASDADHYFLLNDGPAKTVRLTFGTLKYQSALDAITGQPLSLNSPIALEGYSGRWLRFVK
ncbi:hypothetical protein GCM10023189_60240 [Nibrella saemangeumensis]|uniref:beta-galactosidase n=1 Tax=Nibrella saemangeumensis TaxID=1084526 RepID=A0ABP8NT01_9BACT